MWNRNSKNETEIDVIHSFIHYFYHHCIYCLLKKEHTICLWLQICVVVFTFYHSEPSREQYDLMKLILYLSSWLSSWVTVVGSAVLEQTKPEIWLSCMYPSQRPVICSLSHEILYKKVFRNIPVKYLKSTVICSKILPSTGFM